MHDHLHHLGAEALIVHWDHWFPKLFRKEAITLGKRVYFRKHRQGYTERDRVRLLAHEACHVRQYAEYGFFGFLWKYFCLLVKHGYDDHPMEKECR